MFFPLKRWPSMQFFSTLLVCLTGEQLLHGVDSDWSRSKYMLAFDAEHVVLFRKRENGDEQRRNSVRDPTSFYVLVSLMLELSPAFVPRRRYAQHRRNLKVRETFRLASPSMKVRVGILGLPNVGKSTLFNALARKSLAQAENFPFCTIDPNIAPIAIPDANLDLLGVFAGSRRAVPATMDWVDVAGLVQGASRGEGLGNRFLGTLRECNAICHLIRTFEDPGIIHVSGKVDPADDAEVVNLELILADLAHAERRLEKASCQGEERAALQLVVDALQQGIPARAVGLSANAMKAIKSMGLLTLKPVLYAFNVDEVDFTLGASDALAHAERIMSSVKHCDLARDMVTLVSAKLEAEISNKDWIEQIEYLKSLGIDIESKLDLDKVLCCGTLPAKIKEMLDLSVAYTGPGVPLERSRTTRAHVFPRGSVTAASLAGRIHGDIERGFVCAEVAQANELLREKSFTSAREAGNIRMEGKDYTIRSEDVVLIKWSV